MTSLRNEIGQLRQAIVHRPGLELSRLTPDNIESLLEYGEGGRHR